MTSLLSESTPTSSPSSPSPPFPMGRPTSHSFSLQRPALSEEKKTRNSKRLSLLVPPSPGKLEALASIAAETPTAITPSFPPTPSFSSRRRFTSAPLYSSLSTIPSQSPTGTPTAEEPIVAAETSTRRISQFNLDNPIPTARTSANHNQPRQRPISAYFADFSVECGTASPYTVEPVCILPHLYLGAEHNAQDVNLLSRLGITSVLNVAIEIAKASKQQYQSESNNNNSLTSTGDDRIVKTIQGETIHYKNLSWSHHQGNLQSEFPGAFAFIEEAKNKGGKVLVHCQLGVSRSASLVIAYVMKSLQMNLTDAYDFVKSRSSVISPNMSLMYQLSEFGKSLNKPITTAASSASTISRNTNNSVWASSREDDEDDYPYPREMDTDNIESERTIVTSPSPVTVVSPSARTAAISKRSSLTLSPMEQPLARNPSTTTRPRSYYRSPPVPLGLMTDSTTEPPKTPMVDRFLFSGPPPTPMKDRFSFSDVSSTSTTDFMATRSRPRFPDGISLGLSNNESNESFELSAPVPPFVLSHRPSFSTSTTSVSSFATNSSVNSRPSSTSSASSASISICETHTVSSIPESADLPTSVVSARPQPAGAAATKIQTFAKAFTRRWSNGLHSCQQPPPQQPAIQTNGIECLISSEADMDLDIENTNIDTVEKVGCSDPEFIFSPRPFSPSVLETKTFGEFYQALQME